MIELNEIKLKDLGKIITGTTPSKEKDNYYNQADYDFISPKDLTFDSRYIFKTITKISSEAMKKFKNQTIPKNAIMFTSLSYGFGKIGLSGKNCMTNQQIHSIIVNEKKFNLNFIYYLFRYAKDYFLIYNSGIDTPIVTKSTFEKIKIKVPSKIEDQEKIANKLLKYDELIDNKSKCIELYEELGLLIFEEWFLRLRIDGKKLKINPKNKLPEGWKKININNYTDVLSKGPSIDYDLEDLKGTEVINQSCIRNGEIELQKVLIANDKKGFNDIFYLKINDILINSMGKGTLGRVSKNISIRKKMIIHNCITFLRSKKKYSQYMLFYFMQAHQEYFEQVATGSTDQSTLNKDLVGKLLINLPEEKILRKFDTKIIPIWKTLGILKDEIKILKEARDILLPRLMSYRVS